MRTCLGPRLRAPCVPAAVVPGPLLCPRTSFVPAPVPRSRQTPGQSGCCVVGPVTPCGARHARDPGTEWHHRSSRSAALPLTPRGLQPRPPGPGRSWGRELGPWPLDQAELTPSAQRTASNRGSRGHTSPLLPPPSHREDDGRPSTSRAEVPTCSRHVEPPSWSSLSRLPKSCFSWTGPCTLHSLPGKPQRELCFLELKIRPMASVRGLPRPAPAPRVPSGPRHPKCGPAGGT